METVTLTLPNLTHAQAAQVLALLGDNEPSATETFTKTRRSKRPQPEPTVTDEDEEEIEAASDEEEEEETDTDEESDESDDEDSVLSFSTLKDAINKYGAKQPEKMKALLLSFNLKSTKELQTTPKKWEAVYRKVQAALKVSKK